MSLSTKGITDLVNSAVHGDQHALVQLFNKCEGVMRLVATRILHNHDDANDVCQDAFIKIHNDLANLRNSSKFVSWATSIAANIAYGKIRRKGLPLSSKVDAADTIDGKRSHTDSVSAAEDSARILRGMQSLNELDRQTLVDFYFDQQKIVEMSKRLRVPIGTIKRRLHTARNRLAEAIAKL